MVSIVEEHNALLDGQPCISQNLSLFWGPLSTSSPTSSLFPSRLHTRDSGVVTFDSTGFYGVSISACVGIAHEHNDKNVGEKSDGRAFLSVACVGVRLREGAQAQLRSWAPRSTWSPPATIPRHCRLPTFRTGLKQVNNHGGSVAFFALLRDGDTTLMSERRVTWHTAMEDLRCARNYGPPWTGPADSLTYGNRLANRDFIWYHVVIMLYSSSVAETLTRSRCVDSIVEVTRAGFWSF